MIKRLTAIGNSLGIIIERPILDLLNIDRSTDLEVKTDGKGIFLRPIRKSHPDRVFESADLMMDIHEETFRKLAE